MAFEVSANYVVESITAQMADEFRTSKPRPRNRAMGFKGENRRPKITLPLIRSKTPGLLHLTNEQIEAFLSE